MDTKKTMNEYLDGSDWRIKENSNMGFSLQGLNNHIVSHATSEYWLDEVYSEEAGAAHRDCTLHIHDLSHLSGYCGGWDLEDFLRRGFTGVEGKNSSAPPKHLRSALGQLVNILYSLQGEMAGAQAVSSFDTYLAPFVRKDNLTQDEVKQAIQEFVFNMNVSTRQGFQSCFSNITLDVVPSGDLPKKHAVIGGEIQKEVYGDFQKEIDMINIAFCDVMMEGDSDGRVFTFPIPTYNLTEDFDWDSDVADKIFKMTGKFGTPYFSNFLNSDMDPSDVTSMCPLSGKEELLIESSRGFGLEKLRIDRAYRHYKETGNPYKVYSRGEFIECSVEKYDDQKMIEVELENGQKIEMTETHTNLVTKGFMEEREHEIAGGDLKAGYYLPYSTEKLEGYGSDYDLGYFIGCFAGDGSLSDDTAVIFSLSEGKKEFALSRLIDIAEKKFGARSLVTHKDKLITLTIKSKAANGVCRDFVTGMKREKDYSPNVFNKSLEFRQGVYDGHYITDGGNRKRIYTSSEKMAKSLTLLAATMGAATSVTADKRKIEDGSLSDSDVYTVRFYSFNNSHWSDIWYKSNDFVWMKIKSVKRVEGNTGYCLTVLHDEPLFTLANSGIVTHNCRLRIDHTQLEKRGGGLFGSSPMTGSIGVVTLNLPRIGYEKTNKEEFFTEVYRLMDLAREVLDTKRAFVEKATDAGMYPYSRYYLQLTKERFGSYWKNHFSTIGLIGVNEAALNLLGVDLSSEEGQDFGKEILIKMRDKLLEYQEETGDVWNLEATPAEGTTRRLAAYDRKKYPDIIVANQDYEETGAAPFYTNSSQLPVGLTEDPFEALDKQDELQSLYTGGTVHHLYLGQSISDFRSTKKLVKTIAESYKLPYFTISPTFSVCPVHGFIEGEHEYCPKCDAELQAKLRKQTDEKKV